MIHHQCFQVEAVTASPFLEQLQVLLVEPPILPLSPWLPFQQPSFGLSLLAS
jgi:hypothetical protein